MPAWIRSLVSKPPIPAHEDEKPGGVSFACGTVKVDCTPLTHVVGRTTQPAQLRLVTVASWRGSTAPGCAGRNFPTRGASLLVTTEGWMDDRVVAGEAA